MTQKINEHDILAPLHRAKAAVEILKMDCDSEEIKILTSALQELEERVHRLLVEANKIVKK